MQKQKYTGLGMATQLANVSAFGTITDGITATGTVQADAYAILDDVTVFTTVAAGTGARLRRCDQVAPGDSFLISNFGANILLLYPPVGAFLDNGSVNVAQSIAVGQSVQCVNRSLTQYIVMPTISGGGGGGGGTGTVTNIATGTGLTGGPITTTGTILMADTAVTPGSYTFTSLTVDQQGRITAASSGSAPGSGTVTSVGLTSSDITVGGATPITTSGAWMLTLPNVVTAGTNTKVTANAKGLVTGLATAVLASADYANQGTVHTVLHGNAAGNPSWTAVDLANDVTGVLPVANGGTGSTTGNVFSFNVLIDGGGSTITTGDKWDIGPLPVAITLTQNTLLADQSGSIVLYVYSDSYANYPPTGADSIVASAPPTITTATKSQDSTLSGWTVSLAAGNTLRIGVTSCTSITRCTLNLKYTR